MHRTARAKSDALIEKMIGCGKSLAHSECALFYWFDDSGRIGDWVASGLPQSFMDSYRNLYEDIDPLSPHEMLGQRTTVALFHDMIMTKQRVDERWLGHLAQSNIADELEMVFWKDDMPVAGLGLFRTGDEPNYTSDMLDWEAIRSFFEQSIHSHHSVKQRALDRFLKLTCNCSAREMDVIMMMLTGASNCEIAEALHIGLATVKTHVLSIFDKLGVSSRNAVISLAHDVYSS